MGLISFIIILLLWQWVAQGYTSVILPSAIAVILVGWANPTTDLTGLKNISLRVSLRTL